ncbi:hypothetical protein FA95DRAFT_650856 [Auriscalpium vulgare]|uniref:Uncharacterized protein n=1 Tax=Auriscalpium vulgare TaxID=40419 RepID=A0ACB8RCN8_9AGAM|nr:hypothetical protein FA95DRAFT_650856 [Auriscalpium vulgare]
MEAHGGRWGWAPRTFKSLFPTIDLQRSTSSCSSSHMRGGANRRLRCHLTRGLSVSPAAYRAFSCCFTTVVTMSSNREKPPPLPSPGDWAGKNTITRCSSEASDIFLTPRSQSVASEELCERILLGLPRATGSPEPHRESSGSSSALVARKSKRLATTEPRHSTSSPQLHNGQDHAPAGGDHRPSSAEQAEGDDTESNSVVPDSDDPRRCPTCGRYFKWPWAVKRHVNSVHLKKKPFRCAFRDCEKVYSTRWLLRNHEPTHLLPDGGARTRPTLSANSPSRVIRHRSRSAIASSMHSDAPAPQNQHVKTGDCPVPGCTKRYRETAMRRHLADAHGQRESSTSQVAHNRRI